MTTETKRVLITGVSRGIGQAIAAALLSSGYEVIGTSRNPADLDPQPGLTLLPLDLTDHSSIRLCAERAGRLDVLINNAGQSQLGPAEEISIEKMEVMLRINLLGTVELTQLLLKSMREQRGGLVINIGSLAAKFAIPYQSSYVASKFALAGFSWSLRMELIDFGIRVVHLDPNDIGTSITPELLLDDGSVYSNRVNTVRESIRRNMAQAQPPAVVANRVLRIIGKKKPAPYYSVGGRAPLMVFLKRLLPDRLVEKLIRKNYNL